MHLLALATLFFAGFSQEGWECRYTRSDSWHKLGASDRKQARQGGGLRLRHTLPDIGARNTVLVFEGFVPRLSVYVDGALVYDYNDSSGRLLQVATIHAVPLPPGGKQVEFRIPHTEFEAIGIENPYVAATDSVAAVIKLLVNEPLRRDLPNAAIGVVTLCGGLAVLILFFLRRRTRNLALIYLGVVSLLYGARLLMDSRWISLVIGEPGEFWRWPIAFITYTIGIPSILLARNALGSGWKSSLNWVLGIQIAFSIAAICWDLIQGTPFAAQQLNAMWALLFTLAILANLLRRPLDTAPGLRGLALGFVVFIATVINVNAGQLGLPAWQPWGVQLEPYGFLVLLAAFAYFVARQAFTKEERLVAVQGELDTARRIQQSILPHKIPSISNLEIAACYVPMTAVAGDFYDFIQVDSNRIGILVADVSGHGVPAALVASMVKIAFAGQSSSASDPSRVLSGMNEILHGRVQRQFLTAVYAFIDAGQNSILYASAGHPPPLLRRAATNTIEQLEKGGLVIGPFRKTPYANSRIDFEPGDRLLLYTDGITEAAGAADEFYGDRSFQEFIREGAALPARQFTDELVRKVHAWSSTQGDDLTVVTVDFMGQGVSPAA